MLAEDLLQASLGASAGSRGRAGATPAESPGGQQTFPPLTGSRAALFQVLELTESNLDAGRRLEMPGWGAPPPFVRKQ